MIMNAYNELYLDDAMKNLGDMIDYAVCDLKYDPDEFFSWFINSGIADKFGKGNPKYVVGMSGVELVDCVLKATNIACKDTQASNCDFKSKEYWAGWILAYYQWQSGKRFEDIVSNGLSLSKIMSMYILHEADESKFIVEANKIINKHKKAQESKLHIIRTARGFTQKRLSDESGVSLRMIQLYEQKQNDIGNAQAKTVVSLAKVLGCSVEDLIS